MEEKLAIYTESKRHLVVSRTQSFLKEPDKSFSELRHPFYLVSYQFEWSHVSFSILRSFIHFHSSYYLRIYKDL